jgi:hypothetical protein
MRLEYQNTYTSTEIIWHYSIGKVKKKTKEGERYGSETKGRERERENKPKASCMEVAKKGAFVVRSPNRTTQNTDQQPE